MARKGKLKSSRIGDEIERPIRYKKYLQFFLIACEDEKTEPAYFEFFKKQFPKETLFLEVAGTGTDPRNVVRKAIEERDNLKERCLKEIDFVWVVFDKDDADSNGSLKRNFEEAFIIAEKENIKIAYSNEAFELWLLLHFKQVDREKPIPRNQIYLDLENSIKELTGYEDFKYIHGDPDIIDIVIKEGNENNALLRAKELIVYHGDKNPIEANPSTRMYELVEELRGWIAYHAYEP